MHSIPVQTFAQGAVLFYQQNREHTDSAVVRRQERMDKMKYTSAQANKLLKKLNDEYSALLDKEQRSRDFRAAMGEDVESVRPAYDYAETQARLAELEGKIRALKHAINGRETFNLGE